MASKQLRVGVIGLNAQRGWANIAHVPALRGLDSDYMLAGVGNSSSESAAAAASALGVPMAFQSTAELISSPEIDLVVVTVKTPNHYALVKSAIEAGKSIYCEWPLGNGLQEAEELAGLAARAGVRTVIGLQACVAPEVEQMRHLVQEGFVGEVLSTTMVGAGGPWGAVTDAASAYALDRSNGTTLLSIAGGHALSALQHVLGDVVDVRAVIAQRRSTSRIAETGLDHVMTSPDQVIVAGLLESGAPLSFHLRGGGAKGVGLCWEINGTEGDIRITAPFGQVQLAPLTLTGARDGQTEMAPIELPSGEGVNWPKNSRPGNVARLYAQAAEGLRMGERTAPDFATAVKLHRLLAAIETSGESGERMIRSSDGRWSSASGHR